MAKIFASVLIDTYNHERFIEQAIVSVLEQDFSAADREIIVVDDGSTDCTAEIVKKFEPHVRLLRKENGGQASAFNAGIPECKGEIIAFLDGDDWWARGKLGRVMDTMNSDPSIGMVGHAIVESFEDGQERIIALEHSERLRLSSVAGAYVFRLHRCYLGTSRLTIRAELAREILPVPEPLIFEADEYLFTMAAALADVVILREPLTHYRIHGANLFLAARREDGGLRRKQRVLEALNSALDKDLRSRGLAEAVVCRVVELVRAEAAQLRLMLDGGSPRETYRTENTIYRTLHGDATRKQKLFRYITMISALVLPPKLFYAGRGWLARQPWYVHARREYLPVPKFTRVFAARHGQK